MSDGRLGNQIFQYAFLKNIAEESETLFLFNMQNFFSAFDINEKNIIHIKNRFSILLSQKILFRFLLRPLCKLGLIGYVEQRRNIDGTPACDLLVKKGLMPVTLVNTDFFQSEYFFDKVALLNHLKIKEQHLTAAQKFLAQVPENHAKVFIHVRRGDYTNEIFMGTRGIDLPKRYFERAIQIVKEKNDSPFFIFVSDDPTYVEDCFESVEPKLISRNSMAVDMAIMSCCEVGVISNSSFSWWGSALIGNPSLIIAPRYWYGWKQRTESHPGIYPSNACAIDFTDQ